jgi:cyclopropane-fatty-acyl-phospholipid synthase
MATMAEPLQKIIASRYGGRDLPVTLVLPDGGRLPLASRTEIDIVARSWTGLMALASPALGRLARAYVRNEIDFTGSARRILGIVDAMVGAVTHGKEPMLARWRAFLHHQRANRRNIQHHYDVSDSFYKLWLDSRMVYSCAYFADASESLDDAQARKLDHICRKLRLSPGETFLDIGCGWGGLIFWAATRYGVKATGVTLSQNQFDYVKAQIAAQGLEDQVTVELRDYLELPEDVLYDKIASVGMFEHVGVARYPKYFGKIYRMLKPGGLVMNHGITHNIFDARSLAAASAISSRNTCSRWRAGACVGRHRGIGAPGPRTARRRGDARALREDLVAVVRPARSERRRGACGSRRRKIPDLADLSRGVGARRSIAAGCRCSSCWRASRSPTAGCRIR